MTITEVALQLGKSERTVQRWVRQGKLKGTLVDGRCDIEMEAIRELGSHPRQVDTNQSLTTALRVLNIGILSTGGTITTGGLASLVLSSWVVGLAALLGGVCGLLIGACCWAAGASEP